MTELCDGYSLHKILHDANIRVKFNLEEQVKNNICKQTLEGIQYLHNCDDDPIIHRDIKPLNILIYKNYLVKICDLGVSKGDFIFTKNLQTLGVNNFKGTLPYMAPEVVAEEEATVYSDIWSLGCTLIEVYQEKVLWDIDDVFDFVRHVCLLRPFYVATMTTMVTVKSWCR